MNFDTFHFYHFPIVKNDVANTNIWEFLVENPLLVKKAMRSSEDSGRGNQCSTTLHPVRQDREILNGQLWKEETRKTR